MDAASVSAVTGAVSFTTIVTGIGAIGAAVVVLKVAKRGVKALLSAI